MGRRRVVLHAESRLGLGLGPSSSRRQSEDIGQVHHEAPGASQAVCVQSALPLVIVADEPCFRRLGMFRAWGSAKPRPREDSANVF